MKIINIIEKLPFLSKRFDGHMREVIEGAAVIFIVRIIGTSAQFCFNVLLARTLGGAGMGVYTIALLVSSVTSIIATVGLDQSLLRFISVFHTKGEVKKTREIYATGFSIAIVLSVIMSGLVLIFAQDIASGVYNQGDLANPIRLMAVSIVPFTLLNITAASLRAIGKILFSALVQTAIFQILCLLLIIIMLKGDFSPTRAIGIYVFSVSLAAVAGIILWLRSAGNTGERSGERAMPVKELIGTTLPLGWLAIIGFFASMSDTLLLGIFRPTSEVGIYAAVVRLGALLNFMIIAINSITGPKFAVFHEERDLRNIERLAKRSTRLMLFAAAPVIAFFILAPSTTMSIFGREFTAGAVPLAIITSGQLINVIFGPVGQILIMTGEQNVLSKIMTFVTVVNIALCFVMIPLFGLVGAALSNVATIILSNIAATYVVNKRFGISTHLF